MLKINNFYSIILGILAIAGLGGSIWAVNELDPDKGAMQIALFYLITGAFVIFLCSLAFYSFKQKFGVREQVKLHFFSSLRQGLWVGILYAVGLFLESQGLFTWINSLLLIIALVFLESYFLYNERKPRTN